MNIYYVSGKQRTHARVCSWDYGVRGNKEADRTPGEMAASDAHVHNMAQPHRDYYAQFNQKVHKKWQQSWNNQPNNQLHGIKTELK